MIGTTLNHYRVVRQIGSGGPGSVRGRRQVRELRRGLAEAQARTRC